MNALISKEIQQEWINTLEVLEKEILSWEDLRDPEILHHIRRVTHTFKGECGMLGLSELSLVCHEMESYLEKGDGQIHADSLLEAVDWFMHFFLADENQNAVRESPTGLADRIFTLGAPFLRKPKSSEFNPISLAPVSLANEEMAGDFVAEFEEHLVNAEKEFLEVESRPEADHKEAYNTIFRAFHSIKGIAAMMGLEDIRALAHSSENLLDLARQRLIEKNSEWIEVAFTSIDRLRQLMEEVRANAGGHYQSSPETFILAERINLLSRNLPDADDKPGKQGRAAGTHGRAAAEPRPGDEESDQPGKQGHAAGTHGRAAAEPRPGNEESDQPIGQILVEQGAITKKELDEVLEKQIVEGFEKKTGELLIESGQVSATAVAEALEKQSKKLPPESSREIVKVDVARLDALIDAIGELVITQSIVGQSVDELAHGHPALSRTFHNLEKRTKNIQELSLGLRMISIRALFEKMHRLVRDLSKKTQKAVQLKISGEDTELDRSIVEHLADPLMHMIRSAVDHGMESDARVRTENGKPAEGTIWLRAFHKEGKVHLEIADDGKGIAEERLLQKAIEKKLIPEHTELSRREILDLIFLPGFSTAAEVTELSGRGVGMDVVKRNIQSIRGSIDIDSAAGRGTTFRVVLPLTLAIIEGLLVRVGTEKYVVPMLEVMETVKPREGDLSSVMGKGETVTLRDKVLPLFRLSRLLDIPDAGSLLTQSTLLISGASGQNVAVAIDEVLGLFQILIKPLDSRYKDIRGLSGCAILPDGAVHLILELRQLCRPKSDPSHSAFGICGNLHST